MDAIFELSFIVTLELEINSYLVLQIYQKWVEIYSTRANIFSWPVIWGDKIPDKGLTLFFALNTERNEERGVKIR